MSTVYKVTIFLIIIIAYQPLSMISAQWKKSNGPYGGAELRNIISDGVKLFGITNDSVYVSSDKGSNWKAVYSGLPHNPEAPGLRTFFSIGYNKGSVYAGTFAGVYRSTNNGEEWIQSFGVDEPYPQITAFGFHDTVILAGITTLNFSGIFRSIDNGISWSRVDSFSSNWFVNCFLSNHDTIFAGLDGGGLLRSTDFGKTWEHIDLTGIMDNFIRGMIVKNNKLYIGTGGGFYCSEDNGVNWKKLAEIGIQTFTEIGDYFIAAGSYELGIQLSMDGGKNWIPRNNGFIKSYTIGVSSVASFNGKLFATTNEGLFVSADTAATWSIVNLRAAETTVNSLVSGNDGTIYSGTAEAGFFKSTNMGKEWIGASTGLPTYIVYSAAILDSNLFIGTNKGMYRSSNRGDSWVPVGNGLSNSNIFGTIVVNGSDIFAAGSKDIFKSSDGGENWTSLNVGLTSFQIVNSMIIDGENIFVGTSNGFFKSTNYGLNWEQNNTGLRDLKLTALLKINGKLYAGTYIHGVYYSTDNGSKWSSLQFPQLSYQAVHSLAAYNDDILIVGTDYGVLTYSLKDSSLIPGYKTGLPSILPIKSLAIQDSMIFAGTYENSVWCRPISELITGVEEEIDQYPADFNLYQNYPNPFNPITTIEYSIPQTSFVSIEVYDILGRSLAQLVKEVKQPGKYSVRFNGVNMPSGVYFYSISAGAFHQIRKMVFVK